MENPQIKLAEAEINENNPWSDDALDRKFCAETLTKFLENQTAALTIGVNGAWGTGKTFFLRRWEQSLKKSGYEVVYFNAWKDDCLDDPLIAIVGQLLMALKEIGLRGLCLDVKKSAGALVKNTFLSFLNGVIEKGCGIDFSKVIKESWDKGTGTAFDEYISQTEARDDFRKKLQTLANKVYEETGKPLIYIVDELDRCRPDFAVKVLERIKHLFDIDHVIFVLGIDREQLGYVIQSVYGNIDVENYLHRFIDFDVHLPHANQDRFFYKLWEKYKLPEHLTQKANSYPPNAGDIREGEAVYSFMADLLKSLSFSLREIEHCLKLYALIMRMTAPHIRTWPQLAPSLIIVKLKNPSLYRRWVAGSTTPDEIADWLFLSIPQEKNHGTLLILLAAIYASFKWVFPGCGVPETPVVQAIRGGKPMRDIPGIANVIKTLSDNDLNAFSDYVQNADDINRRALIELSRRMDLISSRSVS